MIDEPGQLALAARLAVGFACLCALRVAVDNGDDLALQACLVIPHRVKDKVIIWCFAKVVASVIMLLAILADVNHTTGFPG